MTETAPPWLLKMRAITGMTEEPGSGNNPQILAMADTIAEAYPEMATYCALYTADSTAWCGLCVAYCLTVAGIRPTFGPTDTDKFLWAKSFDDQDWGYELGTPRPGCIVVMSREGGGHVTLYERTEGKNYICRGGNQSDMVNQASYQISTVIALMWPLQAGEPPPAPRRTLKEGDEGSDVEYLQDALGLPADGEFGPVTKSAVKGFQTATGLVADGVCGPATWTKVDDLVRRNDTGTDGLDDHFQQTITEIALRHPLQHYNWDDRGRSPSGYVSGMGQAFALAVLRYLNNDPVVIEMAQAEGDADDDALAYFHREFAELGMDNSKPGIETLRHLFVLLIGLGMRESSGKYCEGRDITATNTSSETCEAGAWQTSWNIKSASSNIPNLLEEFWTDPNGFRDIFAEGITPTVNNLDNYGGGQGASYQFLSKYSPCFAAYVTAIGLRTRKGHWGPVVRYEVELAPEADDFLKQVEILVRELPVVELPEPEPPEPTEPEVIEKPVVVITIDPPGSAVVEIIGGSA